MRFLSHAMRLGMVMIRSMTDCHDFLEPKGLCEASKDDHAKKNLARHSYCLRFGSDVYSRLKRGCAEYQRYAWIMGVARHNSLFSSVNTHSLSSTRSAHVCSKKLLRPLRGNSLYQSARCVCLVWQLPLRSPRVGSACQQARESVAAP